MAFGVERNRGVEKRKKRKRSETCFIFAVNASQSRSAGRGLIKVQSDILFRGVGKTVHADVSYSNYLFSRGGAAREKLPLNGTRP